MTPPLAPAPVDTSLNRRRTIARWARRAVPAMACGLLAMTSAPKTAHAGETEVLLDLASNAGQITNTNGGCLDLPNGNTANGTLLQIYACNGNGIHQTWFADSAGSIHYGGNPNKCIDFPAQDLVNGIPNDETQLQLWDCNNHVGLDQMWRFNSYGNIFFGNDLGKCVELRGGSAANGTAVQVYDCNKTSGQTWHLVQGGPIESFQLRDGNGACLDLPNGNTTDGTKLQLWACDTGENQSWYMDGHEAIHFALNPNKCVDFPAQGWTTSGTFLPETQLQLWDCNGGSGPDQQIQLTSSNTLVVAGKPCVEAYNGSAANGNAVQGFGCNGTTGQTWFPQSPACATGASGCGVETLSASTTIAAYGNGGVTARVSVAASSTGKMTMTPVITNTNQLTGYQYVLECSVGYHELAMAGYVGAAGFNLFGSSTQDAPGEFGMTSPAVMSDWPNIRGEWTTNMTGKSTCLLTIQAYSTFGAFLSQIGADIVQALGFVANAYLQEVQIGDISAGDLCMECTSGLQGETSADFCAQQCPNPDVQPCGSGGISCEELNDYPVPGDPN